MSLYDNAEDLLDDASDLALECETVTLPNGRDVMVRGLTRVEHLWLGKGTEDALEIEARLLSKGMLRPVLSVEQAKKWQEVAGTLTVSVVSDKIRDLSGFGRDAAKSDVAEARDGS
jgi:hypothetical protein